MCDQQSLRSACAYAQSDQSLCWSLEYSMTVTLLTEHTLEFLSLKGGCTGLSESTHVKMPHCWKSHVAAHLLNLMDVRSTKCFESYLGNRSQLVNICKVHSDSAAVTCKRSILGLLLFLCYVNDMVISIDQDTNFHYMLMIAQSCFLT